MSENKGDILFNMFQKDIQEKAICVRNYAEKLVNYTILEWSK